MIIKDKKNKIWWNADKKIFGAIVMIEYKMLKVQKGVKMVISLDIGCV